MQLVGGSLKLQNTKATPQKLRLARDGGEVVRVQLGASGSKSVEPLPPGRYVLKREGADKVLRSFTVTGTEAIRVEL